MVALFETLFLVKTMIFTSLPGCILLHAYRDPVTRITKARHHWADDLFFTPVFKRHGRQWHGNDPIWSKEDSSLKKIFILRDFEIDVMNENKYNIRITSQPPARPDLTEARSAI